MIRPYQIYAVQAIVECIHQNQGNGYIWHTTRSGKTLTSFKASTLLKDNPDIDKCLCILVLKKCKKYDDVLFINAADNFEKGKRQNRFNEEHIARNVDTYQFRSRSIRS